MLIVICKNEHNVHHLYFSLSIQKNGERKEDKMTKCGWFLRLGDGPCGFIVSAFCYPSGNDRIKSFENKIKSL